MVFLTTLIYILRGNFLASLQNPFLHNLLFFKVFFSSFYLFFSFIQGRHFSEKSYSYIIFFGRDIFLFKGDIYFGGSHIFPGRHTFKKRLTLRKSNIFRGSQIIRRRHIFWGRHMFWGIFFGDIYFSVSHISLGKHFFHFWGSNIFQGRHFFEGVVFFGGSYF